jgi:hypothetical protein
MHTHTTFSYFLQKRGNKYQNAHLQSDKFGSSAEAKLLLRACSNMHYIIYTDREHKDDLVASVGGDV